MDLATQEAQRIPEPAEAQGILSLHIAHMRAPQLALFLSAQPSAYNLDKGTLRLVAYSDDAMREESFANISMNGCNFASIDWALTGYGNRWYVARNHEPLRWVQVPIPWTARSARKAFFRVMRAEYMRRIPPPWETKGADYEECELPF